MASARDVRDMMGMRSETPGEKAAKIKKKTAEPKQRQKGITREVAALMGDSVPMIVLNEGPKYKGKPFMSSKSKTIVPWAQRSFTHGARSDGLVLRHWKKSIPSLSKIPKVSEADGTVGDVEMKDENNDSNLRPQLQFEEEFESAKWNVKVNIPTYTTEQYETHLKSNEWTKNETDYLIELCRDYDLRWILIADRYSLEDISSEKGDSVDPNAMALDGAEAPQKPQYLDRKMEDLKSRYYTVAAKMLEIHTPADHMTQAEFQLWEKMQNFDAKTERMRKDLAEKLFERTKDEAEEERILLEELHRITKNEEEFLALRRDLYSRLEPPPTKRSNGEEQSTAMYQTASGLSVLLQTLLAKEKRFKRPSTMSNGDGANANGSLTPGGSQAWERGRHPNQYTRRDTMDTQASDAGPQKKSSQSGTNVRILTPAEELKFGVSHPQERLTSGASFRHEKIHKIQQAKSQVQTTKIQQALTELGIPVRLVMPTDRVCKEFERLVADIQILLDARKMSEKLTSEVKVLEEARRLRLGIPNEGDGAQTEAADEMEVDDSSIKPEGIQLRGGDPIDEDQDAEGEADDHVDKDQEPNEGGDDGDEDDDEDANDESAVQAEEQDEDEDGDEEDEEDDADGASVGQDDDDDDDEPVETSFADPEDEEDGREEQDEEQEDDEEAEEPGAQDSEEEAVEDASVADQNDFEENEMDDASAGADSEAPSESRPSSSHSAVTKLRKRSASMISDASRAGSNRSELGRKRRR